MESSINYFKPNVNTARYNSYSKSRSTIFFELDKIGYLKSKGINKFWSSWIEGNMSSFNKKNLIKQFKTNSSETFSLLTNAKCLTEGIDVPRIDTICFLDPKKSQVDIAQAVGRVMRKVKGKLSQCPPRLFDT